MDILDRVDEMLVGQLDAESVAQADAVMRIGMCLAVLQGYSDGPSFRVVGASFKATPKAELGQLNVEAVWQDHGLLVVLLC